MFKCMYYSGGLLPLYPAADPFLSSTISDGMTFSVAVLFSRPQIGNIPWMPGFSIHCLPNQLTISL